MTSDQVSRFIRRNEAAKQNSILQNQPTTLVTFSTRNRQNNIKTTRKNSNKEVQTPEEKTTTEDLATLALNEVPRCQKFHFLYYRTLEASKRSSDYSQIEDQIEHKVSHDTGNGRLTDW